MAPALHGTIVVVDVVGFGDLRRTNTHQVNVRTALYRIVDDAFARSGVNWTGCHHEDRGDGILVVLPPTAAKAPLVESLPGHLLGLLSEHNAARDPEERIRLRVALHAGEVHHDDHGVAGRAVTHAFRLVDAPAFRAVAAGSSGDLAVIASAWFYEEVVWHSGLTGYEQVTVGNKETTTTAWVWSPSSQSTRPAPGPVPHQLPTNIRRFVGREAELNRLTALLDESEQTGGTVVITAIDGSAGIGKTSLALHWAHTVKTRFPDGHLHVNLRGFDPREPMDAGQALHDFLQALGVAPESIPAELDAKAALYRSVLADRRMLVVLDNARSSEHVRPLLPGTSSCITIVTSRNRLDGLVIRDGAQRIPLDVMSEVEARALLTERVPWVADDHAAADELIQLCARLPLALSVVAARAAVQPSLPLRELAREIREERNRLDLLDLGEVDLSVRAVFSWSYAVLPAGAARLFVLLGVHSGPDIDLLACDALLGAPARAAVLTLTRAHLLTEYVPGRYRFHDLLRAYSTELAETAPDRTAAVERVLDHYVTTALHADTLLLPFRDGVLRIPEPHPRLTTYRDAMTWFAAEDTTLLAMVGLAADLGRHRHVARLVWACATYLRRNGRLEDRVAADRLVIAATRASGDQDGQVRALCSLARVLARIGRFAEGLETLTHVEPLLGSVTGTATRISVQLSYARVLGLAGRFDEALAHARAAHALTPTEEGSMRQADTLNSVGKQLSNTGDDAAALPYCEQALAHYRRLGSHDGQAEALVNIGDINRNLGHHDAAIACFTEALEIDRQLGDWYWQGEILENIGRTHLSAGDSHAADIAFEQALAIFTRIRHPKAEVVAQLRTTVM
ncbi:ATP-binding protein [Actinophytocola algeriensis]|uniref:Tetratricopeptide (TPR) repeat protein n=1 Tax=Actinophytocola algeriensis TaxID=1768010 RepID=A0A7W7Q2Y5_9PSEU|nr:tetratricopeptide repeat protein [Actinophytocola algeriensis]MBB4905918.1 tetratricopeptide (TPR) repeat protein [Actinophytocola algeriensis]MBE1472397.1 tetratricopeptide (TPR) repeat protein [Actinophytocola algeriensis]